MSNWSGWALTSKGKKLQLKAQAGTTLKFTKVCLGDGYPSNVDYYQTATELIHPVKTLAISSATVQDDGFACIKSLLPNTGLTSAIYLREMGIYAQDPDDGEILYGTSYDNAADLIPVSGGSTVITIEFDILVSVGTSETVTAEIIDSSSIVAAASNFATSAKEAAENAESWANAAKQSEENLGGAETIVTLTKSAQDAAAAARTSENNSKTSETNSKTSETNAKSSETKSDQDLADIKTAIDNASSGALAAASLVVVDGKICYVCADDWDAQTEAAR